MNFFRYFSGGTNKDNNNKNFDFDDDNMPKAPQLSRSNYSRTSIIGTEAGYHHFELPDVKMEYRTSLALGGTAAATMAATLVSPLVAIVDLAMLRTQMVKGAGLFNSLGVTVKDLRADTLKHWNTAWSKNFMVYGGTYFVANHTKALCHEFDVDYKIPTATATSVFNVTAIMFKDRAFARLANPSAGPAVMPLASYALFAMRDGVTITSSFVFKNMVQEKLEKEYGLKHRDADLAASFAVPVAAQFICTPLHILAFDLYGRKRVTMVSRMAEVAHGYTKVCTGRIMRIIPAFGLGTFINDMTREAFFEYNGITVKGS